MSDGFTLRQITEGITLAQSLLAEDVLGPDDRAEVERALQMFAHEQLPAKAEGYCAIMAQLQAEATALKAEEERLASRRVRREQRLAWMKTTLQRAMEVANVEKMEGPRFTVALVNNPPAVEVLDESLLPAEFWRHKPAPAPEVDRRRIAETLREGKPVPGAQLIAGKSLRVR